MTIAEACEWIRDTVRPEFHGQITVNVKGGSVMDVDIRQIHREAPSKAA